MPTLMPSDTHAALGENATLCDSRPLLLDRYCDPTAKEKDRQQVFTRAFAKPAIKTKTVAWSTWVTELKPDKVIVFAQLQSHLMVNMSGGVMENAGLCLDRFGLPYIPGSAVKGCARRAALAALHEWCETGQKPGTTEADKDNLFKAACDSFTTQAEMLTAVARVFGWAQSDWSDPPDASDFAWACGKQWEPTRAETLKLLGSVPASAAADGAPAARPEDTAGRRAGASANGRGARAPQLKDSAGSVSFLPAYPVDLGKTDEVEGLPLEVPSLGKLELDVVTCHHGNYYAEPDRTKKPREWEEWNRQWGTAPDTEEPVPVVFPAVAPGHVFMFALVRLRGADANLLGHARAWLKTGLETFGLGAKTNAGYGWFHASDPVQQAIRKALTEQARRRQEEQKRQEEDRRRKADEEDRRRKAEAAKAVTKEMTPEQKADYQMAQLSADQFRGRLDQFVKRDKPEQEAIVRAIRLPADQVGSRRQLWDDLKLKAQKGGKPAQIEQAIRQLSKQMFPGKEGKMP